MDSEDLEILPQVEEILNYHHRSREKLIPILQQVQERLGYLPVAAMQRIARAVELPAVEVYGLATFYNQFRLHPPGDHQIKVCMGTACYMVGGQIALDSFERRLKLKEGETTADCKFSLERVACVGCCTLAPVVVINERVEGRVTPTRVDGLLMELGMDQLPEHKNTGLDPGEGEPAS